MTAVYLGNNEYATATSAPVTVTVAPAPTSMNSNCYNSGGNEVCGAYLSAPTSTPPTGNVVFTVNGVANTVPVVNGQALLTIPNPAPGTYTVVVSYAQQGNFGAATPITESFTIQ